jgi:hypothetical protein
MEVEVDDVVSIKGKIYKNALNDNKIIISFKKGKADNPIINAIVLFKGSK